MKIYENKNGKYHQDDNQNSIILYDVKDIQNIFKCGIKYAYKLVNMKGFPSIKIGGKILIEKYALEKWLNQNAGRAVNL